ncbi:MAG: ferritin-like domain-containing protein [SAR202 cluster bacterium]|nr:ferritin-like domain-containing protein [SAR202 cluster bacterium]
MDRQALLDKLSESLMVEQGGYSLYAVALSRAQDGETKGRYQEFLEQTSRHSTVLVDLIKRLGSDPNYVSPMARLAQVKASSLLDVSMRTDGLTQDQIAMSDLESIVLAETKDHADWKLLSTLAEQATEPSMQTALRDAAKQVEPEEDNHLTWAKGALERMAMNMLTQRAAPDPSVWQEIIFSPIVPIDQGNPAPMTTEDGLLEPSKAPAWQESLIARSLARGGRA